MGYCSSDIWIVINLGNVITFCTHLGVHPRVMEAPPNPPSSESKPPPQEEGTQQQTWQKCLLVEVLLSFVFS